MSEIEGNCVWTMEHDSSHYSEIIDIHGTDLDLALPRPGSTFVCTVKTTCGPMPDLRTLSPIVF